MRRTALLAPLLAALLLLAACAGPVGREPPAPTEAPQADFLLGMDVSSLISLEQSGVRYYDPSGQEKDLLQILAEAGLSHIRVRIWNDPYDAQGRGFGGGSCDLDKALALARRAARYDLGLIADFHYSDFWADPGKQQAPRAWADLDPESRAQALYAYTLDCLRQLRDTGAEIALVQLGNEINNGLCGETDWAAVLPLLSAGARAVRESCPGALVAVHFTEPQRPGLYRWYAGLLRDGGLDYDVFASSWYPFWHGSRENLAAVLTEIHRDFGKQVLVMETAWPSTDRDTDYFPNSFDGSGGPWDYPLSPEGQTQALLDLAETLAGVPGCLGLCYWEGAWISVGGASREENQVLWERYGSGWASSYAAVYDPEDAGRYYGGSSWDNMAFFDVRGRALDSLEVFRLIRGLAANNTESQEA